MCKMVLNNKCLSFGQKDKSNIPLTVLFIGLGSIGKCHLRILRQLVSVKALRIKSGYGVPADESDDIKNVKILDSIAQAMEEHPDFAIIATPSAYHLKPAEELIEAGIPFIIEKPVSHRLEGLDALNEKAEKKKIPVLVGFQMRYHPAFKKVMEWIHAGEIGRPLCLVGEVGQYLPDWRLNVDYRLNYSAWAKKGGGAILDLCHEIDIALKIMGPINKISCVCGTYSDLEIDSEDIALITAEHKNRAVSNLCLNYIERGYTWKTRVLGSHGTINWDYGNRYALLQRVDEAIIRYDDPPGFNRDDLFRTQLKMWLDVVWGNAQPYVTLKEGIDAMAVCSAAKQSAKEGRHILL
jgi:predicted dehydrogenase